MQTIETSIDINAPPERIWDILTDTNQYDEWNPFILKFEGEIDKGEQIRVDLKSGDGSMTFKPIIQEVIPNQKFSWLGKLFLPKLFDAKHIFELKVMGDGTTKFIHKEEFRGLLVWPLMKMIRDDTKTNFNAMNKAIKSRVERLIN